MNGLLEVTFRDGIVPDGCTANLATFADQQVSALQSEALEVGLGQGNRCNGVQINTTPLNSPIANVRLDYPNILGCIYHLAELNDELSTNS